MQSAAFVQSGVFELRRKPPGFEGFLTILKPLCPSDQPVAEGEDNPVVVFHLDAARLAAQLSAHASRDPVAAITDFVKFIGTRLPWLVGGHEEVPYLVASLDMSFRPVAYGHHFDVGMNERAPGVLVATFEGGLRLTHPVDILLGHRLLSIS